MTIDSHQDMTQQKDVKFGSFRLSLANQCLWRNDQAISLTPKAFAVLCYLVERAGQLVSKDQLLNAIWPQTYVTDAVLKVCIREIRQALDDDARNPQFIETAHRRGYRFIGKVLTVESREPTRDKSAFASSFQPPTSKAHTTPLVGREAELRQLCEWLQRALRGERQVIFITGEPGIGKTALIEAFLESLTDLPGVADDPPSVLIARGQCLNQYGSGEAYLPVLDVLGRLCRGPACELLVELLHRHAPTWLVQMPWLIKESERDGVARETLGATRERMLRELTETIEQLTLEAPLVFVLEDMHWSDYSTLDFITAMAQRRECARLMVLATYRPVEIILSGHPLKTVKQELATHRRCQEIALEFLTQSAVTEYLKACLGDDAMAHQVAPVVHQRTDGNPLFMISMVDYLLRHEMLVRDEHGWHWKMPMGEIETAVPDSIRQIIEKQVERLPADQQQVLEAMSIAGIGVEFSAAAVAALLEADVVQAEEACEKLSRRRQFIEAVGVSELPDGTVCARYGFIHQLYQNVLYDRISPARRSRMHRQLGLAGERIFANDPSVIAGELAMHFERGREKRRAIHYLQQVAAKDVQRSANREAIAYLSRALKLAEQLPESDRPMARLELLEQRGRVYRSVGQMNKAVQDFTTMMSCAQQLGRVDRQVWALLLAASAQFWINRQRCLQAVDEAAALSEQIEDELLRAHMRGYCGHWSLNLRGWRDEDAQAFIAGLAAARQANEPSWLTLHTARESYFECMRSNYLAASRAAEAGMQLALQSGEAFDYMLAKFFGAWGLLHGGQWARVKASLQRGIQMAERNGHTVWAWLFRVALAWLYQEAYDFEQARALCEPAAQYARSSPQESGQLLFKSLIVSGLTYTGLEQWQQASACFDEITAHLSSERWVMDWILNAPLHYGLAECRFRQGDLDHAQHTAELLCELTSLVPERTYLALGHRLLADVAMSRRDWHQAEAQLTCALSALKAASAPLAQWRVYATAARFYEQRRSRSKAKSYWARSAAVLHQLADSLDQADGLRHTFLNHPAVQAIFHNAQPS